MPRGQHNRRRNGKNSASNVRILDQYSGTDGAKFDRIMSGMQNSHSQIRTICQGTASFTLSTSGGTAYFSAAVIRATDDFQAFASEFETYRITAVRFDVYDINPALVGAVFLSTWHDVVPSGSSPVITADNVLDGPDSQIVPPGTGKVSFTWTAKGSQENDFQTTTAPGIEDFGGLRAASPAASAAGSKLQIVIKAIVDFRGRI